MGDCLLHTTILTNQIQGNFDCICPDLKVKHSDACVDISLCSVCHSGDAICIIDETVALTDLTAVKGLSKQTWNLDLR